MVVLYNEILGYSLFDASQNLILDMVVFFGCPLLQW